MSRDSCPPGRHASGDPHRRRRRDPRRLNAQAVVFTAAAGLLASVVGTSATAESGSSQPGARNHPPAMSAGPRSALPLTDRSISRDSARPALPKPKRASRASQLRPIREVGGRSGAAAIAPKPRPKPKRVVTVPADPRAIAQAMLGQFGWSAAEFPCLDQLWAGESGWNPSATNASSGAYGIPQALPAEKMAAAGADWRTNPATQIAWGLGYIASSYGSPCGAEAFKAANGWY